MKSNHWFWDLSALVLVFFVTSFGLRPLPAVAAYQVTKFTDNAVFDGYPQIDNNNRMTFLRDDGANPQIIFYTGSQEIPLLGSVNPDSPQPSMKDGTIAWSDVGFGGYTGIALANLNGQTSAGSPYDYGWYYVAPQVNGQGDVVWEGQRKEIPPPDSGLPPVPYVVDQQIFLYHDGDYSQISEADLYNSCPQINDNGQVAWFGAGTNSNDVWLFSYTLGDSSPAAYKIPDGISFPQDLHLNNQGQTVWRAYDGHDYEIYSYKNGILYNVSNNDYDEKNPQINDAGIIVWQGNDGLGSDDEIYLYDYRQALHPLQKLTVDNYNDYDPQINSNNQVAWASYSGITGITYLNVYDYHQNTLDQIYPGRSYKYSEGSLCFSDRGQMVWEAEGVKLWVGDDVDTEIFKADPVCRYDFTFQYDYENPAGADYYQGYFYDSIFARLYSGTLFRDQYGKLGQYNIDANYEGQPVPGDAVAGQVYVTSYYDHETDIPFTPVNGDQPLGTGGLGSEVGYIIRNNLVESWYSGKPDFYQFSKNQEADSQQSQYYFTYQYAIDPLYPDLPQDEYSGFFYAPTGMFQDGEKLTTAPQGRGGDTLPGYYEIYYQVPGFNYTWENKFSVTSYYDTHPKVNAVLGVNETGGELATGIEVEYWTTTMEEGYALNGTAAAHFSPYEPADVFDTFRFVVFGDTQADFMSMRDALSPVSGYPDPTNSGIMQEIVKKILTLEGGLPDFAVFLGDMGNWAYDDERRGEANSGWFFNDWMSNTKPLRDAGIEVLQVVGNHDLYELNDMVDTFFYYAGTSRTEVYGLLGGCLAGSVALGAIPFVGPMLAVDFFDKCTEAVKNSWDIDTGKRYAMMVPYSFYDASYLQTLNASYFNQDLPKGAHIIASSGSPLNLAFEYGNSFFSLLDSYWIDSATQQYYYDSYPQNVVSWLQEQAAATEMDHKFSFSHAPPISSYVPGYPDPYPGEIKGVDGASLWNVLVDNDYDIVFGGHQHLYARGDVPKITVDAQSNPIFNEQGNPIFETSGDVVMQIIAGSAGAPLEHTVDPPRAPGTINADDPGSPGGPLYPYIKENSGGIYYDPTTTDTRGNYYHFTVVDVKGAEVKATTYGLEAKYRAEQLTDAEGLPLYTKKVIGYTAPDEYGMSLPIFDGYYVQDPDDPNHEIKVDYQYPVTQEVFDHWDLKIIDAPAPINKGEPEPSTASYCRYDFTFSYNSYTGNGDHYSGYVYAPAGYNGYDLGTWMLTIDENGTPGSYTITHVTDLGSDGSKSGQVYIESYYDQESGKPFVPVGYGAAVGYNFLGSESDYIIANGVPEYYFGEGYYEADLGTYRYKYIYLYPDGDFYTGEFLAPPEKYADDCFT